MSRLTEGTLAGGDAPAEAAGLAQALGLGQIALALPQGVFSLLAHGDVLTCNQDNQPAV
jgi:hypothetical protein